MRSVNNSLQGCTARNGEGSVSISLLTVGCAGLRPLSSGGAMSNQLDILLYRSKQTELFDKLERNRLLCRCNVCTDAFNSDRRPVWERNNYVVRATLSHHFRRMAAHPDRNMRVCAHPDSASSRMYFHPTQVLAELCAALRIDSSGTHLGPASVAAPRASSISGATEEVCGCCLSSGSLSICPQRLCKLATCCCKS